MCLCLHIERRQINPENPSRVQQHWYGWEVASALSDSAYPLPSCPGDLCPAKLGTSSVSATPPASPEQQGWLSQGCNGELLSSLCLCPQRSCSRQRWWPGCAAATGKALTGGGGSGVTPPPCTRDSGRALVHSAACSTLQRQERPLLLAPPGIPWGYPETQSQTLSLKLHRGSSCPCQPRRSGWISSVKMLLLRSSNCRERTWLDFALLQCIKPPGKDQKSICGSRTWRVQRLSPQEGTPPWGEPLADAPLSLAAEDTSTPPCPWACGWSAG